MGDAWAGGREGNNKARENDDELIEVAVTQLEHLGDQMTKITDPFDSFYANEIERMEADTTRKIQDSTDTFNLQKDQAQDSYQLSKTQGQRNYQEMVSSTEGDIKRMQEKQIENVQNARASSADASYDAMKTTLAGGGKRRDKTLDSSKARDIRGMTLDFTQQKDAIDDKIRSADINRTQSLDNQALSLTQKNDTAELTMDQTRSNLESDLSAFTAKMNQEQDRGIDRLKSEAQTIVQSTITSFTDKNSSWGQSDGGGSEPWADYIEKLMSFNKLSDNT